MMRGLRINPTKQETSTLSYLEVSPTHRWTETPNGLDYQVVQGGGAVLLVPTPCMLVGG